MHGCKHKSEMDHCQHIVSGSSLNCQHIVSPVAEEYWQHVAHLPFYSKLELREEDWGSTVPITWHTDGVRIYKSQKAWVYSFAPAVRKGRSLDTKMLTLLFREHDMTKPGTHDDVGLFIAWCMEVLRSGLYPSTDMNGKPWPRQSREAKMAGKQFAGGWKCAFAAFKADLEARVLVHKLVRNWSSYSICEHCLASRKPGSPFTFGDFTENALYLEHFFTHSEFLILNPPDKQSSWVHVRGWDKDRNLDEPGPSRDMLHVVHQGVGQHAVASLISHHYEDLFRGSLTLGVLERLLQTDAWPHYKSWCRDHKEMASSSMPFNLPRFNRESWKSYPELGSCYKAACVKTFIFWCAAFLRENMDCKDPSSCLRADAAYSLAHFQHLQDLHGAWLTSDVAEAMSAAGRNFLILYQALACQSRHAGQHLYHIVPKFHCLLHLVLRLPIEKRNPAFDHLYQEEDYMKEIGKIASRTHARTMDTVTLLRSAVKLGAVPSESVWVMIFTVDDADRYVVLYAFDLMYVQVLVCTLLMALYLLLDKSFDAL
ncbi:unnamed protein product [Symbiodinium natans]|uniref:Uncharacterized protein n=1 Tax=Symbiodinium natans TaxID=878477 RepID=A0A812LJL3_9DINO|nr:unnamed protein product [Symbiodinium natans]